MIKTKIYAPQYFPQIIIFLKEKKKYERLIQGQIIGHIDKHLSKYLCGYRKGYNTQHALISLIEKWKCMLVK